MNLIMPILAVSLLTFWGGAHASLQEIFIDRWHLLLGGCAGILCWRLARTFHWTLGLCAFAVTLSGLAGAFLYAPYSGLPWEAQIAVKESAASSLVSFLLLAWITSTWSESVLRRWQSAIAILGPVTSFLVLGAYFAGKLSTSQSHFLDNPSLVGTTIAVAYPLFMHELYMWRKERWSIPAGVGMFAAMVVLGTSTQLFAFFGAQLVVLGANVLRGRGKDFLPTAVVLGVFALAMGFYQDWGTWLNTSERPMLWGWGVDMMRAQPLQVQLTGTGLGTAHLFLPLWQAKLGISSPMYFTFHNDWLQFWVEQGMLGLVAALAVLVSTVRRVWSTPWLLGATTAYALSMVTNFTTHWPLQAFMGFILVRLAFSGWTAYSGFRFPPREMHV